MKNYLRFLSVEKRFESTVLYNLLVILCTNRSTFKKFTFYTPNAFACMCCVWNQNKQLLLPYTILTD